MELINMCCCCLLRPPEKNMKTMYKYSGVTEIFSEMLEECFQIYLPPELEGECGICEACVCRLRDARCFKLQVLHSQASLQARLSSTPCTDDLLVSSGNWYGVKTEFDEDIIAVKAEMKSETWDDTIYVEQFTSTHSEAEESTPSISEAARRQLAAACRVRLERVDRAPVATLAPARTDAPTDAHFDAPNDARADDTQGSSTRDVSGDGASDVIHSSFFVQDKRNDSEVSQDLAISDVTTLFKNVVEKTFGQAVTEQKDDLDTESDTDSGVTIGWQGWPNAKAPAQEAASSDSELFTDRPHQKNLPRAPDGMVTPLDKGLARKSDVTKPVVEQTCDQQTVAAEIDLHEDETNEFVDRSTITDVEKNCSNRRLKQSTLKQFNLLNTGEKLFSCKLCSHRCSSNAELNVHNRVHTGERPFGCDICLKRFGYRSNLARHKKKHKGQIEVITKQFSGKYHLDVRKGVHIGDKKYGCKICLQRFKYKGNLKRHKREHEAQIEANNISGKDNLDVGVRVHTGDKKYSCDICLRSFKYKCNLVMHKRKHDRQIEVNKQFSGKYHLDVRKGVHIGDKKYGCGICLQRFKYKGNLKRHKREHEGQIEANNISGKDNLDVGMHVHTGDKKYSCDTCLRSFSYKCNLVMHKKKHERQIELNNKQISGKDHLDVRKGVHTGEKLYSCDMCLRSFSYKCNLVMHKRKHERQIEVNNKQLNGKDLDVGVRVHTGDKKYSCDICLRSFKYNCNLVMHKRKHERQIEINKKQFNGKDLDVSMRVPTGDKKYSCDICLRSFSYKCNLIMHKRKHERQIEVNNKQISGKGHLDVGKDVHTGDQIYGCDICLKRFTYKRNLAMHKKTHEIKVITKQFSGKYHLDVRKGVHIGDKKYGCKICLKRFNYKGNLKRHKREHEGQNLDVTNMLFSRILNVDTGDNFKCNFCDKQFNTENDLNMHKRIHTGDKPYICLVCNKQCATRVNLVVHKRVHTGERPYGCDICLKRFNQKCNLKRHKLIHK